MLVFYVKRANFSSVLASTSRWRCLDNFGRQIATEDGRRHIHARKNEKTDRGFAGQTGQSAGTAGLPFGLFKTVLKN
jgi:hypothetical protein